ncbi:alpha-amylase family glycosyl hydrolase [Metamycoplasma hyosynoviae]|uniref:Glycosyl hydrolase family 13 catalytic domain-containing protein n=1 Tax=Metamycoplasma hyosynoviae TaxID=29559 RepID=A0A9Q9BXI1_9BACT|nr:hypothetical protein [Metamycoplasma hyosynoviae]MDD1358692.1 hypothetical protein [Metamycoplasma hyosynoviae]MDD1359082.1 hypothetical protein [Metamycoplasma hyosynoviae]MDD1361129.1 hypothetical protein [Metamycoplasma hyosynoviae]UTO25891.1 hypothetical protein NMG93_03400 [Metamycoplasma hyosynoviae]UTO26564.1 hypothetical protein NMG94_03290 [Metamycoplasma hyosynoviae]
MKERIITYEIKIETFKDNDNNGIGDFKGLSSKLDYFKYLNINYLFINDILKQYENVNSLESANQRFGSLDEFIELTKLFNINKVQITPIIDLTEIKQSYINWKNMMRLYSDDFDTTKEIEWNTLYSKYVLNNDIQPNERITDLANFILYFDKVINFYNECGVKSFVLKNFEFLIPNTKKQKSLSKLEDIYKMIKRLNPDAKVILNPSVFNKTLFKKMIKSKAKVVDYLYINSFTTIGIDKQMPYANKTIFNFKEITNEIKFLYYSPKYIICLGSDNYGRIQSMWGCEKAFLEESTKALISLLFAGKSSIGMYYGDELGMTKTYHINLHKNEKKNNEEKRFYQSKKIPYATYEQAKKYQSPESSYALMSWSDGKNSGFGDSNNYYFSYADNVAKNNVELQKTIKNSPLNYFIQLTEIINNEKLSNNFDKSRVLVKKSNHKRVVLIKRKYKKITLYFALNLADKPKRFKKCYGYQILASNNGDKIYEGNVNMLEPYESILFIKEFSKAN